jgi:hypothetical protein
MSSKEMSGDNAPEEMPPIKIPTNKIEALQLIYDLLRRLSPIVQVLVALTGLVIAGYFGSKLRSSLNNDQENVERTLGASLVSTAYPHRGVAAFLLAELDKTLPPNSSYDSRLKPILDDIDKTLLDSAKDLKAFNPEEVAKSLNLTVNNIDSDPTSKPEPDLGPAWKKAVTNKEIKTGFLMVPAISLRRVNPTYNEKSRTNEVNLVYEPLNDINLTAVLKYNPEVVFDLQVASVIEQKFRMLDSIPVQSLPSVQTYFISESGVIFLRTPSADEKIMSYPRKFPRYTLFMDRPYFWGAVDPKLGSSGKDNGPFNYQTDPYIDLGGNGVVKTYSRKIELPNNRVGVICIDVKFPSDSVKEIERRLKALGANVQSFYWITSASGRAGKEGNVPDGFEWVETQLRLQEEEESRLLGAIAFESDYPQQRKDGIIRFSIPIESTQDVEGRTKTRLLLVTDVTQNRSPC